LELEQQRLRSHEFRYLASKGDIARLMVQRIAAATETVGAKTVVIPECSHAVAYGTRRLMFSWYSGDATGSRRPPCL
jgi:hypothetical protein